MLRHNHPENVILILEIILESTKQNKSVEHFQIKALADFWDATEYFNDLTMDLGGKNIIENPKEVLESFFKRNSQISVKPDQFDMLIKNIEKGQYYDLVTTLMFDVQNIVQHRYPENSSLEDSQDLFVKDTMAMVLFKELSKQPSVWKKLKNSGIDLLVSIVISVYFSILERDIYLKALLPDAQVEELIQAIKKTGSRLPEKICKKIVGFSPIPELKNALSEDLNSWGDIWIVKIMGRIGSKEFVPDLIKVLNNSDSMDYIYSDAINSMNALDESADEMILNAIENKEIGGWKSFSFLEYLPYSESFDLISKGWDDENNEMDSYETLAYCLRGIGDERGIAKLQNIYGHENNVSYIGNSLECLSIIHNVSIHELYDIHQGRKEEDKRQKARAEEFNEISKDIGNIKNKGNVVPFKREMLKVGRNEPCPCGSGKKYFCFSTEKFLYQG